MGVYCTGFYVCGGTLQKSKQNVFSLQVKTILIFSNVFSFLFTLILYVCFILKIHIVPLEIIRLFLLCYLK